MGTSITIFYLQPIQLLRNLLPILVPEESSMFCSWHKVGVFLPSLLFVSFPKRPTMRNPSGFLIKGRSRMCSFSSFSRSINSRRYQWNDASRYRPTESTSVVGYELLTSTPSSIMRMAFSSYSCSFLPPNVIDPLIFNALRQNHDRNFDDIKQHCLVDYD